jgi:hypothetical protein
MNKRIFTIWGRSGVGKTTTLKLIAKEIQRSFFHSKSNIELDPLPSGDIVTIITINLPEKSVKIGITSKGDPNTDLQLRLEELVSTGCDIIFCATRTSGTTVKDVEEIEKKYGFRAIWVTTFQNGHTEEQPALNQQSAEQLVRLMRFTCNL